MNRRRRMHGRKRIKRTPFSKKKSITDTPKVSDLNPGANRTLVKAAEDAAMADVPHDYTRQFKTIEDLYLILDKNWEEYGEFEQQKEQVYLDAKIMLKNYWEYFA